MPPPAGPTKALGRVKLQSFKAIHVSCKEHNTYIYNIIYIHILSYIHYTYIYIYTLYIYIYIYYTYIYIIHIYIYYTYIYIYIIHATVCIYMNTMYKP